jgi:F420-non-reducing hydrogenase small subunit
VQRFRRRHEVVPDASTCLLDQGLICMGVATRQGCGALCPRVNMGCEGCYGPPEGVHDVGARMVGALAGMIAAAESAQGESRLREEVEEAMRSIVDPAGTFYRFSLAHSLLRRARVGDEGAPGPENGP